MSIMTQQEILNSIIPITTIEDVTLEAKTSGSREGLRMIVKFSISDISENDAISQWFKNKKYEEYFIMKPRIVCQNKGGQLKTPPSLPVYIANLSEDDRVVTTNSDGLDVVKFVFERKYEFDEEPKYLSFSVDSTFDLDAMEAREGIDLSFLKSPTSSSSRLKTITIIRDSKIVYPIQDFRARSRVSRNRFSMSKPDNFDLNEYTQEYEAASRKLEEAEKLAADFLSDFWISRSAQGEAKFLFILDASSFYEKKSEYRKYFKRLTVEEKKGVIGSILINSLKVKRKRVKVIQTPTGREVIEFDRDYPIQDVIETKKRKGQMAFERVATDVGAIKQINISEVGNRNLFFLTGTDYQTPDLSDGIYAYGVSVEIVDTMKNILLKKIDDLRRSTKKLKEVLNILTLPRNYDSYNKIFIREEEEILREYSESENEFLRSRNFRSHIQTYNDVLNIFTDNFSEEATSILITQLSIIGTRTGQQNLPEIINAAIEVSDVLVINALSDLGEPRHKDSSEVSLPPSNLLIEGGKFYMSPEKLFDANIPKYSGLEYLANFSESSAEDVLREISTLASDTEEIGLKVIDGATYERRVTAETNRYFLSETLETTIPVLSESSESSRINLNGPGSEFFTMSAYMDGSPQETSVFRSANDTDSMSTALRRNIHERVNNYGRVPGEVIGPPRDPDRDEAAFFAKFNVAFDSNVSRTIVQRDLGISTAEVNNQNRTPDTDSDSGSNSIIVSEARDVRSNARANQEFEKFVFSKFTRVLSTPNLGTERTLGTRGYTERQIEETLATDGQTNSAWTEMPVSTRSREFVNSPNIVKAFSLVNSPQTRLNQIPSDGSYKLSLNFLAVIEFLSGFEDRGVSDPIWEPLTHHTYSQNSNKNILCRISRASIDNLGVRQTATGKPIYDSCFIIKPTDDYELDVPVLPHTPQQHQSEQGDLGVAITADLRRNLAEKNELLEARKREVEEINTKISEALETIDRIRNDPANYIPRRDREPIMKSDARFSIEYWQSVLYDGSTGLYPRRENRMSEIQIIRMEISSLRERLRRAEGSDIARLDLRSAEESDPDLTLRNNYT